MITATIDQPSRKRAAPKLSAAQQIDKIASSFSSPPTIDEIPDPLRDALVEYAALEAACDRGEWTDDEKYDAEEVRLCEVFTRLDPTTAKGAAAALRFIRRGMGEDGVGEHVCDLPLLEAVLRFLEREDPRPEPVSRRVDADPVFALIERHDALWPRVEETETEDDDNPEWLAAASAACDAMRDIAECEPTTLAGCRAAAVYIAEHPANKGYADYELILDAFSTLARSLKAHVA